MSATGLAVAREEDRIPNPWYPSGSGSGWLVNYLLLVIQSWTAGLGLVTILDVALPRSC